MGLLDCFDEHETDRSSVVRSPLYYMGAKRGSLEIIHKHVPSCDTFVDVMCGSAQVLLSMPRRAKLEVLNDRNAGAIALYRCLQNPQKKKELQEAIDMMPHSRELFVDCKETWMKEQDDVIRGAKWYYLIQCSFAGKGICFGRTTKGYCNVWDKIHESMSLFQAVHERLQRVVIENQDWRTIFKDFDSHETVFYLDPPYFESNVYYHNFSKADHTEMCERIFDLKGTILLSGFKNEIYDRFPWDHRITVDLNQLIVNKGNDHIEYNLPSTKGRREMLYIKEYE